MSARAHTEISSTLITNINKRTEKQKKTLLTSSSLSLPFVTCSVNTELEDNNDRAGL